MIEKTGQSIDQIKRELLTPALVKSILQTHDIKNGLSLLDLGSGTSESVLSLIKDLNRAGYKFDNCGFIDADAEIFPYLISNNMENLDVLNSQYVDLSNLDNALKFLEVFQEKFSVVICQLVLHQIENIAELSFLMNLTHSLLQDNQYLYIVNLHPKYLDYLEKKQPNKFSVINKNDEYVEGEYHFDSGGSNKVYSRDIQTQLSILLALGFDLIEFSPISTEPIANKKELYKELHINEIPMFYLLKLKKNNEHTLSIEEGAVKKIKKTKNDWLQIEFSNGNEILIPEFSDWNKIVPGDLLILHEVYRQKEEIKLLNYWIIPADGTEKKGGQLVVKNN